MSRALWTLLILAACGSDSLGVAPEANPLGSTENILPYPSSLYESNGHLDVPVGAFPKNFITHVDFDSTRLAARRGWPATTTLLWAAPAGVDPAGLVGPDALADSVGPTSATVIVDMMTGE